MPTMRADFPPLKVDAPAIYGFPVGPQRVSTADRAGDGIAATIVMVPPGGRSGLRGTCAVALPAKVVLGLGLVSHDLISRCSGNHHGSVVAWPNVWFTESIRVRDGESRRRAGRKNFPGASLTAGPSSNTGPTPPPPQPSPKSFAILDAGGFGGHPEDMLPRSCVCVLTVGLPDPSRQRARPDAGAGWSGGIVLLSKTDQSVIRRSGRGATCSRDGQTGTPGATPR